MVISHYSFWACLGSCNILFRSEAVDATFVTVNLSSGRGKNSLLFVQTCLLRLPFKDALTLALRVLSGKLCLALFFKLREAFEFGSELLNCSGFRNLSLSGVCTVTLKAAFHNKLVFLECATQRHFVSTTCTGYVSSTILW